MPRRYGKAARQVQGMAKYANLYAKQFAPDAVGVIVHKYPRGTPAYEVEVLAADGSTIGVHTVGHAKLMLCAERAERR
jgi:hypothetical protein